MKLKNETKRHNFLKVSIHQALARLPAGRTDTYPGGAPFVRMLAGETMSVEVFAPKGADLQQPHAQDGLYFIHSGTAQIIINEQRFGSASGDAAVVTRAEHGLCDVA
jgi:hypothetical protein